MRTADLICEVIDAPRPGMAGTATGRSRHCMKSPGEQPEQREATKKGLTGTDEAAANGRPAQREAAKSGPTGTDEAAASGGPAEKGGYEKRADRHNREPQRRPTGTDKAAASGGPAEKGGYGSGPEGTPRQAAARIRTGRYITSTKLPH